MVLGFLRIESLGLSRYRTILRLQSRSPEDSTQKTVPLWMHRTQQFLDSYLP